MLLWKKVRLNVWGNYDCSHNVAAIALCNKYNVNATEIMNQMDAFLVENESESMTLELIGKFEQSVKNSKKVS